MIFPSRMMRIRIILFHSDLEPVLAALRGKGLLHFTDFLDDQERWGFRGMPNNGDFGDLPAMYDDAHSLIAGLESKERRGFIEDIFPKPVDVAVSGLGIDEIRPRVAALKEEIGRLESEREDLEKRRAEIQSHQEAIAVLNSFRKKLEEVKIPEKATVFFGDVPADDLPPILISLEENGLDDIVLHRKIQKDEEKREAILIIIGEERRDGIDRILARHSFSSIPLPSGADGSLGMIRRVRETLAGLEEEERKVDAAIGKRGIASLGELRSYLARVKLSIDMIKAKNMTGRTAHTSLLCGWIMEKDKERFEKTVRKVASDRADVFYYEPDVKKGDVPVALDNPVFIRPFEMLTRMFSPPRYGEIDPTPFLAFAFVLFFGIMFADIFDAILLFVMSLAFYRMFGNSGDAKSIGQILIICSLSAMAFGLLGGEFAGFPLWTKSEILQPETLLVFAIALGIVQIVLGYVLGAVNAIRAGDLSELIGGKIGWLLVLGGALAAYLVVWQYAAISVIGLALVFAFKGLREALDLTRLLSNMLSYVRLLALNMAHVGLSATFASIIGGLFALGITGQVSASLIVLVAHIFLVFVSLFAVFAHALRLQYVEFFSKFYEGGGTIFNPF